MAHANETEASPIQRVTRDDLDRYIGDAVEKAVAKRVDSMNDRLDGLRRDLMGDDKAAQIAGARDKAHADFEQLDAAARRVTLAKFKTALFNAHRRGQVEGLDRLPWLQRAGGHSVGDELGSGVLFTRLAPLILRAKGDWAKAAEYARAAGNVDIADYLEKTLTAGDFDAGGALVPELMGADFIGYLYAASVVRRAGARTIDLSERGNLTLGRQNATATAYWVGEVERVAESEETFGQLKLDLKKLAVLVPVSEDLIKYAAGDFVEIIRDDVTMIAALKEDLAFLRGDGSENQPRGIKSQMHADNAKATAGTSYANTVTDLVKAQYLVEVANVPTPGPVWFMNPRALRGLTMMVDTNDGRPWQVEYAMNGTIEGSKPFTTTQIPKNLTGSGTDTEIYYVEPSQCVIGEGMKVEIEESNSASYGSSNTKSAFARFERLMRLGHEVDFALRHNKAASMITDSALGTSLDS